MIDVIDLVVWMILVVLCLPYIVAGIVAYFMLDGYNTMILAGNAGDFILFLTGTLEMLTGALLLMVSVNSLEQLLSLYLEDLHNGDENSII